MKKNPTPDERPDLYDYEDCRPVNEYPAAQSAARREIPWLKAGIARRRAELARLAGRPDDSAGDESPGDGES